MADDSYTADDIQVLTYRDAVRKRPGMYFGDIEDGSAMHSMLWEIIGNAVDEHLRGHAREISVRIDGARIEVDDDGRGIPVDLHPIENKPALEIVFTMGNAGSVLARPHVHLRPGMFGVGAAAVNALARELEARVWRDGWEYVQRYERGKPIGPVVNLGRTTRCGTRVSFVPDSDIFRILRPRAWDVAAIATRLRDLASLFPGLTTSVNDETWRYDDGIADRVREHSGWMDPFHVRTVENGIAIDLGLAWIPERSRWLHTYVNACATKEGTHLEGLFAALRSVIGRRLQTKRLFRKRVETGLVAMLHVQLEDPRFGNPTKDWLKNPEVGIAVRSVVERELPRYLDEAPAALDTLLMQLERATPRTSARAT